MVRDNYEHLLKDLKDTLDQMSKTILYDKKRIEYLESETLKDAEIKRLTEERDNWQEIAVNSFEVTPEDRKRIRAWQLRHDITEHGLDTADARLAADGTIGGRYSYHFIPTAIGVIGKCKCDKCGAEFEFQSLN